MTIRTFSTLSLGAALAIGAAAPAFAQQTGSRSAQTVTPTPSSSGQAKARGSVAPQGFSVVLVLGDIQGATSADDVPPAARKALTDMREFLPFKSYKLLDAAWLMCCGQDSRSPTTRGYGSAGPRGSVTQILRGPDDREYTLQLETAPVEGSRVFVKFALSTSAPTTETPAELTTTQARNAARRLEDLTDQSVYLRKQLDDARKKFEVGIAPGTDIAKLELELRRVDREIEDGKARLAELRAQGRSSNVRAAMAPAPRSALMDTSFTMDVGETVVVGTSRLKGGSRALIALLTAVPPRGAERKE